MNLILLGESDFINENTIDLKGRRFVHVKDVVRSRVGDELVVGIEGGKIGRGKILTIEEDFIRMTIVLNDEPPPPLDITLILALPRPIVLNRTLIAATSMGVKTIYLINARRVEKSFWLSPRLKQESIWDQLVLGLEQAKDTIVPKVILKNKFKPFVEDELPGIIEGAQAIVAHPESSEEGFVVNDQKRKVLIVGPEGGFIGYEIDKLQELGFQVMSLGERVLRVETAVPVLLSKLGSNL